jgi:hypothetical protein
VLLGTTLQDSEVYGQGMRIKSTVLAFAFLAGVLALHASTLGAVEPPHVTSVAPSPIVMNSKPQALKVTGTGFAPGLTVEVTQLGNTETFSGAAVRSQASTSFEISVVFAQPGPATLVVRNTDGGVSDPFTVRVEAPEPGRPDRPAPQTMPSIDRVVPDKVTKGSTPQALTFNGNNFVQGLSVSVTDPTGNVTVLKGTALETVTRELVKLSMVLDISGEYSFLITNPSGQASNSVIVNVS